MNTSFHVAALSGDQVRQAFPLIQATCPGTDLDSWRSFVEFFGSAPAGKGSGVLALHDTAGNICGVLAYRLDRDLQAGIMLAVHLFTAVDLINSLSTVRALLDAAEKCALELGCAGVQIRLSNDQPGLAARLRRLGLSSAAGLFWKKIDPAPTRS
jgi:hypothetical protein